MNDASVSALPQPQPPPQRLSDFPCPFCGCLCDDLELTISGGRVIEATNACAVARPQILAAGERRDVSPPWTEAVQQATRLLSQSRRPLVWGLRRATCEAQAAAVEIAELLRGVIDMPSGGGALDIVGEATTTLGEVRQRADMVVVWFADPLTTHPRLFERYLPKFAQHFRSAAADFAESAASIEAAQKARVPLSAIDSAGVLRLAIAPGREFEAATVLRGLLRQLPWDEAQVKNQTSVPLAEWRQLFQRLQQARYGVFLSGEATTTATSAAVATLLQELNETARWSQLILRPGANSAGAENVLAWRTGYSRAVDFSQGYPQSRGDEFSAARLLEQGEVDVALIVCDDPNEVFSRDSAAAVRLRSIPTVVVDSQSSSYWKTAQVTLAAAVPGVESPGTNFRLDGVSLALRPALSSPLPADFEVLRALAAAIREGKRS